jgi:transmembrane sensor
MGSAPPSPQARAEAAAWLARLHGDDRSPADEEAFRRWLSASADHAAAFEAVDRTWSAVGGLQRSRGFSRLHTAPQPRRVSRRAVMAGATLLLAGSGSLAFWRSASAGVYETEVGEQKHVALADGSQLFLDAKTRLVVDFTDAVRSANLQYGQVNFRVAPDPNRPFVVRAAQRRIVATQCNFDVRCEDGEVQVLLIHGEADVAPVSAPRGSGAERLGPGERLVASVDMERRDRPNLNHLLAWQSGSVVFENTDLAEAAQEMNRYSMARLEVDPSVAGLKVSGVYRVGDNEAFARSIAKLLPIAVRQDGDSYRLVPDQQG